MQSYWDNLFDNKEAVWGEEAADSAIYTRNFFLMENVKHILIPGIGYGRNAKVFNDAGIQVTGIEISKNAAEMAQELLSEDTHIHHASVTQMPLDNASYDGLFCYATAHLLNEDDRRAFIMNCYMQLKPLTYMVFMVISKKSSLYGQGKEIAKDFYELENGLQVFFYDEESIKSEFGEFGLLAYQEFEEPIKHMKNEEPIKCYIVKCQRAQLDQYSY
jgi:cyclopropane fatty-acyl-phospholipid synthase-like methyltransferase